MVKDNLSRVVLQITLIELEEARQMYGGQEMFSVWKIWTLDV